MHRIEGAAQAEKNEKGGGVVISLIDGREGPQNTLIM
jgi:hypothetical protein